ncbi:MAG: hypothetical protein OHK0022_19460 [Roseiflexaceae bacterium]
MRIFNYLFPAAFLHFLLVTIYYLLGLADLVQPINDLWRSAGIMGHVACVAIYLVILAALWGIATRRNWNAQLPWVLELGTRRGLRIGGVPVFDYGMLAGCVLLVLVVWRYNPELLVSTLYLIGPLSLALMLGLLLGRPHDPEAIIEVPQIPLSEFARVASLDQDDLTRANSLPLGNDPEWTFATRVRLPE